MKKTLIALGITAALQIGAPARAAQLQTIDVAMLPPSALTWVHAVALKQGFYKKYGIAVHELRASDSPSLLQAVASDSAPAGFALGDLAVRAIDKGAPVVIAGALLDHAILRLYGAKSVTTIQQLAGKNVTAGAVKGGTADLLKFQLNRAGVNPNSVRMVSIANSRDRIIAMRNGQVAGALLIAPFDALAVQDGAHLLDAYTQPYVETPLILNKAWAKANPKLAKALASALRDAAAWLDRPKNKAGAIATLASYTHASLEICAKSYAFIVRQQKAVPANLAVPAAGLENIYKISAAVNGGSGPKEPFPLSRYYDPQYLANP